MNRYDILLGKKASVKSSFPFKRSLLEFLTESEIKKMLTKPPIYGRPFLESVVNDSILTSQMRREKVEEIIITGPILKDIKVKENEMIWMPPMTLGVKVLSSMSTMLLDTSV